MLRWRLLLGVLSIAALIGVCWLDFEASTPGAWLLPLAVAIALMATREVLDLVALAQMRPVRLAVYLGNALVVVGGYLLIFPAMRRLGPTAGALLDAPAMQVGAAFGVLLALGIGVLVIFFSEMGRYEGPGGHAANIAGGTFALAYVGLMLSFAVQLRMFYGIGAVAAWIVVVKMGDTGAYAVGRVLGRHKMSPRISPGKTLEGAAGALVFSCLGSWAAFRWLVPATTPEYIHTGPSWGWIAFGLVLGMAGMAGDLAESLLKRDVGVKDSSVWLPGFGGVLDMVDSLLLSAPLAWLCWLAGLVGR